MSTPERKSGQTSWARRQQQQQHNSPFRRARRDSLHLDASHGLSPPRDSPARHRRNFNRTGTLRGAFEYTSRLPLSEIEEDIFLPQNVQRGSPRKRQRSVSAMSSRSNPPELDETYRQIDDALSLTDNDLSDDENALYINKDNRFRRSAGTPTTKREHRFSTASDASFTSQSPHRGFTDYARDEERLKRATTGRSPVFNKAAIGVGPSSEHLQRREFGSPGASEEDYGIEPPVKAPSTWGTRGKYGSNWMKSLKRNHDREAELTVDESKDTPTRLWDKTRNHEEPEEASARLWHKIDSRRAERETAEHRHLMEECPEIPRYGHRSPQVQNSPGRSEDPHQGGQRIPNTPISIFPGSTFTKRSPTKRDSHDLLRKLARTGSPNQQTTDSVQTPQQPAVATERRVYDKTPVVTGAWIDTPMSQRAPEPQHTSVMNALGPNPGSVWGSTRPVKTEDHQDDMDNIIPNFEPMKEKEVVKQNPGTEQPKESPIKARGETKTTQEILRRRTQASDAIQKPMKLPLPEHARSALETVLDDHKNNRNPLDAGDDTLESLQAIVDQQPSEDTKTQEEDDAAYEEQILGEFKTRAFSEQSSSNDKEIPKEDDAAYKQLAAQNFQSKAPAEQEARDNTKEGVDAAHEKRAIRPFKSKTFSDSKDSSDMKASESLGRKLRSLSESFSYVKSGFNKLENQITHHNDSYTASLSKPAVKATGSKPAQTRQGCECKTNGDTRGVIPLPRLWDRGSAWWRVRPTRLGWCILIALGWYFSESTMCDYYCHPIVESTCEGNCLLPDAPRFPYVIPTMTWRWLHLSDILIPLWAIMIAFFRLFTQLLGLSDGYVDDEPLALNLTGKIRVEGNMMNSFAPAATIPSSKNFIPSVAHWAWGQTTQNPGPTIDLPTAMSSDSNTFNWDDVSMDEDEFL